MTHAKGTTWAVMKSDLYNTLKWLALIGLPAIATLYFAISEIWGLSNGKGVVGTITAVDGALGTLLHISSQQFHASDASNDGTVDIATTPDGTKAFSLNLNGDPHQLADQQKITFKVNAPDIPVVSDVVNTLAPPGDDGGDQ